jgi:hypothetical protein
MVAKMEGLWVDKMVVRMVVLLVDWLVVMKVG